jgi:hypothetical protein
MPLDDGSLARTAERRAKKTQMMTVLPDEGASRIHCGV